MGYLKIENLYKNQSLLGEEEVYALEKIHGTSAHIRFENGAISFFSGGEKHERFVALFDVDDLLARAPDGLDFVVYGEAYGGKQQGESKRYGTELKFVAFDVLTNGMWLNVPAAEGLVRDLGLEFVHYERGPGVLSWLNTQRDAPSVQSVRNGITEPMGREGIVIRPIVDRVDQRGNRLIAKHKTAEFSETKSKRETSVNPESAVRLAEAQAIADEWVTPMRLMHVLDKLRAAGVDLGIEATPRVIHAMVEDVVTEAAGEFEDTRDARKAMSTRAAQLFKRSIVQ